VSRLKNHLLIGDVMDSAESKPPAARSPSGHWQLFLAGIVLFVLGPAWFVIQFRMKNLGAGLYVPILSSVGLVLLIASVCRRRGLIRIVFLMMFAVICGLEWYVFLVAARTPAYAGPALPGRKVPPFAARLADGSAFTAASLDQDQGSATVLVFYRGRW
jgi:hypothetical protein